MKVLFGILTALPMGALVYWLGAKLANHESWAYIALDDRMGGAVVARLDDRKAGYVVVGTHDTIEDAQRDAGARNDRLGIDSAHIDHVTAASHARGPWEERPFTRD